MSGKSSRQKGHNFERELAQKFREYGFPECVTSRSESKRLDDLGVDLAFTEPFLVQAKAQEKMSSPHLIISNMPKTGIRLLFHKRNRKGVIVSMTEEDFWKLMGGYNGTDRKMQTKENIQDKSNSQ